MFANKKSWTVAMLGVCALGTGSLMLGGCNGSDNGGVVVPTASPSPTVSPTVSPSPGVQTSFGPAVALGAGTARAYVITAPNTLQTLVPRHAGHPHTPTVGQTVPQEVGIEISKEALANPAALPQPAAGQIATEIRLTPPAALLANTPFVAVSMYYTPGHPPAGAQDVPHFHPNFLLVSDAVRNQILPGAPGNSTPIDPTKIPAGFITIPDPAASFVPLLGTIYFNPAEAGFSETPFRTGLSEFRYFDGQLVDISLGTPITFLRQNGSLKRPLGVPATYPKPGYYPTAYSIRADRVSQSYKLSINDFVKRQ